MYKLLVPILVLTAAVLTAWWTNVGRFNSSELDLFSRIDAVLAEGPPSSSDIVREFRLPKSCMAKGCFFEAARMTEAEHGGGNLRTSEDGLIFVLEQLRGRCIRADTAAKRFGPASIRQVCDHGGCWYIEARRDWGHLSFGLKKPNSACVSSVVINSLRSQRQAK